MTFRLNKISYPLNKSAINIAFKTSPYTDYMWISIKNLKNLELFDNIEYKYINDFIYDDDFQLHVQIKELNSSRDDYYKTQFKNADTHTVNHLQ